MDDFGETNREWWDERAPAHATSPGYGLDRFAADPAHLSDVVRFDLPRLGDIAGLRGVHLRCHIGSDTVSLARLGAHMTGLDFSEPALAEARRLAVAAGVDVDFVRSDLYAALEVLEPGAFDLVFTGVGALWWLPEIRPWARIVAGLLKVGGRLFIREGHPALWALGDAREDQLLVPEYSYFEQPQPDRSEDADSSADPDMVFSSSTNFTWNHGLAETVTALLDAGMQLTMLEEHDSVPWQALPGQMEMTEANEWRIIDRPWRIPHSLT
ncbi:MAG: methyltransferase domain-containing protein, partial [Chloroflexi bacterium]|nr:methyltransferase domain-containing protein [Chloroflexota bacterium]